MTNPSAPEIVAWGRRIHGPTLPGQGIRCPRQTPLSPAELEEVAEIIAQGRREHSSASLPQRLKTRHWESVLAVMARLNTRLGWPTAGWKIGAAAEEIRRAEGVPEPAPGQLFSRGVYASPAQLPANLFINYRCSECEFAFQMGADLPPRAEPYARPKWPARLLGWTGSLIVTASGWFWFFRDSGATIDGRLEAANYPGLGLFGGLLVCAAILVSSAGTHRLIPGLRQPPRSGPLFSPARFAGEVRNALANPSYRMLLTGSLFSAAAIGVSEVFGTYMSTYFWEFRSEQLGTLSLLAVVPVCVGVALARPLSGRHDKRRAAIGLACFAVLFGPLPVAPRLLGWFPANGEPLLFWLVIAHGGFLWLSVPDAL